ncbi:Hypothetical_protein [Hexamita inflata]|uniref:Hypothetical_protein n=1 Tax=Hexamita inflata TaxID=28002 RepID=A0AA86P847_9EUKA|nr:Hypothetical protein HINF_LOCUS21522 [Hexamita inflata]
MQMELYTKKVLTKKLQQWSRQSYAKVQIGFVLCCFQKIRSSICYRLLIQNSKFFYNKVNQALKATQAASISILKYTNQIIITFQHKQHNKSAQIQLALKSKFIISSVDTLVTRDSADFCVVTTCNEWLMPLFLELALNNSFRNRIPQNRVINYIHYIVSRRLTLQQSHINLVVINIQQLTLHKQEQAYRHFTRIHKTEHFDQL